MNSSQDEFKSSLSFYTFFHFGAFLPAELGLTFLVARTVIHVDGCVACWYSCSKAFPLPGQSHLSVSLQLFLVLHSTETIEEMLFLEHAVQNQALGEVCAGVIERGCAVGRSGVFKAHQRNSKILGWLPALT